MLPPPHKLLTGSQVGKGKIRDHCSVYNDSEV